MEDKFLEFDRTSILNPFPFHIKSVWKGTMQMGVPSLRVPENANKNQCSRQNSWPRRLGLGQMAGRSEVCWCVFFLKFSPLETGRCTRTSLGSGVELCRFEALRMLRPAFGGFSSSFSGGFHEWQSPKWLVYDGKSQSKMDDLRVPFLVPPFLETSIFCASRLTAHVQDIKFWFICDK
jgi:hypothetical protein